MDLKTALVRGAEEYREFMEELLYEKSARARMGREVVMCGTYAEANTRGAVERCVRVCGYLDEETRR